MEKNKCKQKFQAFQKEHFKFFNQPIIQSFLQEATHLALLRNAVCHSTPENMQAVDQAFKKFYGDVKALTYFSNLIYFNAINFDKNVQKNNHRELLTLDQPLQDEEGITHKDMLYDSSGDMTDLITKNSISDYIEEKYLYQAVQELTPKQRKILTYKYIHGLKNKEIAALFNNSPQNISKQYNEGLKELRKYIKKE